MKQIKELHDRKIEYTSYELPDGVSFYNIATFANDEAEKELELYAFFEEYVSGVEERFEEEPTRYPADEGGEHEGLKRADRRPRTAAARCNSVFHCCGQ